MKSVIVLGFVIFFLIVSGLHGLMWLLHGITDSYRQMVNGESDSNKAEFRDFMGRVFLLFLVGVGIHRVFWEEVPAIFSRIF